MKCSAIAISVLLACSGVAFGSEGPRYTYIDGGYIYLEVDDPFGIGEDPDGHGLTFDGSVAVADMVHLFGGLGWARLDVLGVDVDVATLATGVGFNFAVTNRVDLVARLAYLYTDVEVDGFGSDDDSGYGLSGGVRAMVTNSWEINGALNYTDFGDGADDTSISVGTVYNFTDVFAIRGGGEFGGDSRALTLGVRFYFGSR